MNKDQSPILAENIASIAKTEPTQFAPKKKYVPPTLSEPEGLLEATRFFFQAVNASSGSGGTGYTDHGHQNTN